MGKTESSFPKLTKSFIGYGHYQLTVTFSDCVEREEATAEAIAFVQEQSL